MIHIFPYKKKKTTIPKKNVQESQNVITIWLESVKKYGITPKIFIKNKEQNNHENKKKPKNSNSVFTKL